jgi:hypothetical protein
MIGIALPHPSGASGSTFSLIYMSRSLLTDKEAPEAIEEIIATSLDRNGREDITGALLFTGVNFVQILEGPEHAVLALMEGIKRDERHEQVEVVETISEATRMFEGWSMAYVGDATFAKSAVRNLLVSADRSGARTDAIRRLRRLMREFVHGSH